MQSWLVVMILVILAFVIAESLIIRSRRSVRHKVDFFLTLHRLLIQRKKIRIEDVIALGVALFLVFLLVLIITTRLQVRFGAEAGAQTQATPQVASELIKQGGDMGDHVVVLEDAEIGERVRRYEEYVFDVQPGRIAQEPVLWEAEDFVLPIGQKALDRGASGGLLAQIKAADDKAGILAVSDGHTLQKPGRYTVAFKLRFSNNTIEEKVARIEIWDEHRQRKLFEQVIKGTDFAASDKFQFFEGTYSRDQIGSFQAKVVYLGEGDLGFDNVEIKPEEIEDRVYERHLFYADVPDGEASEHLVRLASSDQDIPGRIAFGPYDDSVKEGFYRALFRLKVSDNLSQYKVALIDVVSDNPQFNSVYQEVAPSAFESADQYQDFALDFYKPQGGALEFRIYYYGTTDLFFDRVDLLRINPL